MTESPYRASKNLLEHVAAMVRGEPRYVLLDEQRVVYNDVLAEARAGYHSRQKVAVLIKGGPGTGKSVIAVNLVGDLSREGYNAQHATGARASPRTYAMRVATGLAHSPAISIAT